MKEAQELKLLFDFLPEVNKAFFRKIYKCELDDLPAKKISWALMQVKNTLNKLKINY